MDAAIKRTALITVNRKCHQLQANCLVTVTAEGWAQTSNLGQVSVYGSDAIVVLANRVIVHRTHMAHRPTTTTIRKG
jgi:hypothetical protein